MKPTKILIAFAFGGLVATLLLLVFPDIYVGLKWRLPSKDYEYSKAANDYLLRMDRNVAPQQLILIGDSQIESMDTSGYKPGAVNFGIGGDTWQGLAQRVPQYTSLADAKGIVFLAGINDLRRMSISEILTQANKVLNGLPTGVPHYVISVLPVDTTKIPIPLSEIRLLNDGLSNICRINCSYIDVYGFFLSPDGTANTKMLESDGLHLNLLGYEQLKASIQLSVDMSRE